MEHLQSIPVIDTHTGGEPTRVVTQAPFELIGSTMLERRSHLKAEFDAYRRALVCEPRGSEVMVGALLTPPIQSQSIAGIIFFNNVGYLGMCGHGLMGLASALYFLGEIGLGSHAVDTPVGTVTFELLAEHQVKISNVASYRYLKDVELSLPAGQVVHGDVAWGGNWFFICADHSLELTRNNIAALTSLSSQIRKALIRSGVVGADGQEIDHVELIGPPTDPSRADAKNFVLCPGLAYDRSPCGTGTSAKVACLAADGRLQPGQLYRQESIVGSVFEASYRRASAQVTGQVNRQIEAMLARCPQSSKQRQADAQDDSRGFRPRTVVLPELIGTAYVNGKSELIFDPQDPFAMGIES